MEWTPIIKICSTYGKMMYVKIFPVYCRQNYIVFLALKENFIIHTRQLYYQRITILSANFKILIQMTLNVILYNRLVKF